MSSYISPTSFQISAAGFYAPTYAQILAYLQTQYLGIWGQDVYLGNDTQDYQLMAVFAQAIADCNSSGLALYNSFSPATGQGTGLSNNVQINGLSRLVPTSSTCTVTVGGTPTATITNGQCIDPAGNIWSLPNTVTIGASGTTVVAAVCETEGSVQIAANALLINTPTFGWTSLTNTTATVGAPAETDAALRVRQAASVALPSLTIFEGIVAAIENTLDIGRVAAYENNTAAALAVTGGSIPANNLCFICEYGIPNNIWNAIFEKITPGIPTYADPAYPSYAHTTTITDANGSQRLIKYMSPYAYPINVSLTAKPLAGASASVATSTIVSAVSAYLSSVPIGGNISVYAIIAAAQAAAAALNLEMLAPTTIAFASGGTPQATDLQLNYNYAAYVGTITVNVL